MDQSKVVNCNLEQKIKVNVSFKILYDSYKFLKAYSYCTNFPVHDRQRI